MHFTRQQVETLLCALRHWQLAIEKNEALPHMSLDCELLTGPEIDALCEYINCAGEEHPQFPRLDWAHEVTNGETSLGYDTWVMHQVEAHDGRRDA